MDSNPSQPLVSTLVDTGMHKEDQQATNSPTYLRVTNEERANLQLSSRMSAFNLNKPIYSTSFIIYSESASRNDALAVSTVEADPKNSAPSDFVPQQHGMNEGTKNTSYDHLFAGTGPHVLADQTKSVSEGLKTILTQPIAGKRVSSVASQIKEETSSLIKLEDLEKLVSHVQPSFKDLDSPEDDPVIVIDDTDEDEEDAIHVATNDETEDTSHKLELENNKAKDEDALLKAQPSFLNVEQLNELLVKSLKTEFSNILSAHDFSSSLPTELKDLPSKFNELTEEVKGLKKQVHELEIELSGDLKEIPTKLKDFTKTGSLTSQVAELKSLQWQLPAEFLSLPVQVAFVQAKLKTFDALSGLLLNVTQTLNKFAQFFNSASSKAEDHSVTSAGQANTRPTEGEKDTNQAAISQLFQRRANKNAEKDNLNKNKPQTKTPPPPNPLVIITTTTQMQSLSLQPPPKSSSQPEEEHTKEDKGKKTLSSEKAKKESTDSDFDDETHVTGSMVEPSKIKKLKKFDFITKDGRHIHLTEEEINHQKKLEEDVKAEAAKQEGKVRKAELVDLFGLEVVKKYYNDKLKYDKYCDKMLNRRAVSRITNEDERIDYLCTTEAELGINLDRPLSEQDPLDILNDLANKKRKHADDIHDFFRANKRLKSSVQYEDHPAGNVLNEPVLGLDDHARTFSSLLLAKIDKRNLNPLKQMRVIKLLRSHES
ncbi:hypothetical protein Tco_0716306 [Tanacetum coccineum]